MKRRPPPAPRRGQPQPAKRSGRTPERTREPTEIEVVHGLRAVLAVFATRRNDIVRIGYTSEARPPLHELLRWAAAGHVPATQLSDGELARIADSPQHEGVCIETKPRRWTTPQALCDQLLRDHGVAIAFDRIRNPYNIGAILRSAAFFGIDAAILGMLAPHPALSPQAIRVAEGGTEHLILTRTTNLSDTLSRMRSAGVSILGAEDYGSHNAIGFRFTRPCVLVLGHEREGLSEKVRAQCDAMVAIPGAGQLQSLNVSIAASLLIAELQREKLRAP